MTKNALRLALIVGIIAVLAGYWGMTHRAARAPDIVNPVMSGNYSDDWQTNCAPLLGPAQAQCTARLDAGYGRVAGAPLAPAPR